MLIRKILSLCFFIFLFFLFIKDLNAETLPFFAKGKYFSVYVDPQKTDIPALIEIVSYNYSQLDVILGSSGTTWRDLLSNNLDSLYLEIINILDLRLTEYHGIIKIFSSKVELNSEFKNIFGVTLPSSAYYDHENNTLYFSLETMTLGMLGHEIAHAIISHYFVVPPPEKIQEILSGYVEFKLKKSLNMM